MTKRVPQTDEDVLWTGLRWIDGGLMQAMRLQEALAEMNAAVNDTDMREYCNQDTDPALSWRKGFDQRPPYDPERPIRLFSARLRMMVANEADLLIVALRNVMRAAERLPKEVRRPLPRGDALALLRNVAEHFDEVGGQSAKKLKSHHADLQAGSISFTKKDARLGGQNGISLNAITEWLLASRDAIETHLTSLGVDVPAPWDSVVEGDDELEWPPERITYGWMIPQIDASEWPRYDPGRNP